MDKSEIKLNAKEIITTNVGTVEIYNVQKLKNMGLGDPNKLPYSHRILLENIVRNLDNRLVTKEHLLALSQWDSKSKENKEIPFNNWKILRRILWQLLIWYKMDSQPASLMNS